MSYSQHRQWFTLPLQKQTGRPEVDFYDPLFLYILRKTQDMKNFDIQRLRLTGFSDFEDLGGIEEKFSRLAPGYTDKIKKMGLRPEGTKFFQHDIITGADKFCFHVGRGYSSYLEIFYKLPSI